jgi:lysyl-tRNA synthetase class 2
MLKQTNWQKIRQNPALLEKFLIREQVMDGIRSFFKSASFHEVETPLLVEHPGTEPYLEVFATELLSADGHKQPAYLLTSPEYAMKKLLVAGMGPIFQVCKSFRNGKLVLATIQNFDLEWYRPRRYTAIMDDCENLLPSLCTRGSHTVLSRQSWSQTSWERISVPGFKICWCRSRNDVIEELLKTCCNAVIK